MKKRKEDENGMQTDELKEPEQGLRWSRSKVVHLPGPPRCSFHGLSVSTFSFRDSINFNDWCVADPAERKKRFCLFFSLCHIERFFPSTYFMHILKYWKGQRPMRGLPVSWKVMSLTWNAFCLFFFVKFLAKITFALNNHRGCVTINVLNVLHFTCTCVEQ